MGRGRERLWLLAEEWATAAEPVVERAEAADAGPWAAAVVEIAVVPSAPEVSVFALGVEAKYRISEARNARI